MNNEALFERAKNLNFYGLLARWESLESSIEVEALINWEEKERSERGLKSRLTAAKLGKFKALSDFDWSWPQNCDRVMVEELMGVDFIKTCSNVILLGPNGVGKSTIACNIGYEAVLKGHTVLCVTASQMLNDLCSQDGDNALSRRLKYCAAPTVLICDELGYLSYSNRHADLLFEIISRRYKKKSTVVTTNKPFVEWDQIFPNASCVVSLVDRLVHQSEILTIDGGSYRLKEAKEHAEARRLRLKKTPTG